MMSDDSDDNKPLSVLAGSKKLNPNRVEDLQFTYNEFKEKKLKKKRIKNSKRNVKKVIENPQVKDILSPTVLQRPLDVWLYLKDFNQTGPYSCLLCSEWFINRSKIIVHYVLNHKKDFCGICRYFVPDREAWIAHQKFHVPWQCSQCIELFETEQDLRQHFSLQHNLVHCRLCHFRIPDNDQYNCHLRDKHNVTHVSNKDAVTVWDKEQSGSPKYLCLLCSKSNNLSSNFFNHYMCYHHITLKCFSNMISGRDPPFTVNGANITTEFLESQLKDQTKYGYLDLDQIPEPERNPDKKSSSNEFIPEIKQENLSESEEIYNGSSEMNENKDRDEEMDDNGAWKTYEGIEDFDVTSTELVVLQKSYFDYLNKVSDDLESSVIPDVSEINYESAKLDFILDLNCPMCSKQTQTVPDFSAHMNRMHSLKIVPVYSCRICATNFDNQNELTVHAIEELAEFEDLWLCQFCDKEFDTREATRIHLTDHWDIIEMDNCFSPHLGFKCRYCPILFWNEKDRESHQKQVHFIKNKEDFYKCHYCLEMFSDKVWFIYHYIKMHYNLVDTSNPYLLKCTLCCIVMTNLDKMRTHFNNDHPEAKKIFCSLDSCSFRPLAQKKSFKFHLKTVHKPSLRKPTKVSCPICSREFDSQRACGGHQAHCLGSGRFKCKICSLSLRTADERKLHYLLHHPGRHPFECNVCGRSFPYKSSLYTHKQEHKTIQHSYTCSYCSKVFLKRDSYREHMQIHEGPRHACSYCPMRFVQRSNMLRHERRHTGERPYSCEHCGRAFADKGACSSHARTHNKTTSYPCLYCGQTFAQKSKLKYHVRKHTGENLETCPICSKLFTSACSLREHMKIHNKAGSVPCPLCDRKYRDERYMIRHVRNAHGVAEFRCPICEKRLSSAPGLRQHVITHSAVKTYQCKFCPKSFAIKKSILRHLRRRHSTKVKSSDANIKDFINILDVRDCKLGLDEEVMTKIFGPPKKLANDIMLGDFVTFPNKSASKDNQNRDSNNDDSDDGEVNDKDNKSSKSNESDSGEDDDEEPVAKKVKSEPASDDELEPTDFVTVKIEHVEADD